MKAASAPQEHCETESEIETADRPEQWNGIRAAQTGTSRNDTRLGRVLQAGYPCLLDYYVQMHKV
jgi:hypothetical protein